MRYFVLAIVFGARAAAAQAPALAPGATLAQGVTAPPSNMQVMDDGVRLAPGDVLRITVWRRPEMSGDSVIGDDGTLSHPLYRAIQVTGVPMRVVEERMRAFLARFNDDPQFAIEPMVRVSVTGEVRNANLYTLTPRTTLAQAVEIAGGITERGRRDDIRLLRAGNTYKFDLTRLNSGLPLGPVRSGDEIFVRRHHDFFREYLAPTAAVTAAVAAVINASQHRGR